MDYSLLLGIHSFSADTEHSKSHSFSLFFKFIFNGFSRRVSYWNWVCSTILLSRRSTHNLYSYIVSLIIYAISNRNSNLKISRKLRTRILRTYFAEKPIIPPKTGGGMEWCPLMKLKCTSWALLTFCNFSTGRRRSSISWKQELCCEIRYENSTKQTTRT